MNWVPLGIFLAVFFSTIAVGLIAAPYWIHGELEQDRNKLRITLDKRAERRDAINRLWQLRKEGVEHRNEGITMSGLMSWLERYEEWRAEVLVQAGIVSEGLQAWLTTLDQVKPPPTLSSPSIDDQHQHKREIMSEILRRLQNFLEAEMLNKDIARTEY
jgi:hypothetical protein